MSLVLGIADPPLAENGAGQNVIAREGMTETILAVRVFDRQSYKRLLLVSLLAMTKKLILLS